MKEKKVVRTYRNGKSVFQQEYVIRLCPNIAKTQWQVTERRALFKDEKVIFFGKEKDAEKFYTDVESVTLTDGVIV